jgi:hypothetical protein
MMKRTATKRTQPIEAPKQDDYNELARMISGVLNHPLTPADVYTALADSISNLTHTAAMDAPQTIGCILYHDAVRQKASKK